MKIRDVLSPTDIIVDVRASDKTRLLQHLSARDCGGSKRPSASWHGCEPFADSGTA